MQLSQIIQAMDLKVVSGDPDLPVEVDMAHISDILSDVMARGVKGAIWITKQTHMNVIAICYFKSLAAVILPDALEPDESVLSKAREKSILVLSTPFSTFEVAGRLYALGLRGL